VTPGGRLEEKVDPGDGGYCGVGDVLDSEAAVLFVEIIVLNVLGSDEGPVGEVPGSVRDSPEDSPDNPLEELKSDDDIPTINVVPEREDKIVEELDVAVELKSVALELLIRTAVEVSEGFAVCAWVAAPKTRDKRRFLAKNIAIKILR
jgi:hypothetical protein